MPSLMRSIAASVLLILVPQAYAEDAATTREYWVSIASFEEFDNAETARKQASEKLTERLSITPATIPSGYVLRVVAGPYFDRVIADQVLETIRLAGYDTAWIFSQEVPALNPNRSGEYVATEGTFSGGAAFPSGATFPSDATFPSEVSSTGVEPSGYEETAPALRSDFVPPPAQPARNDPVLVEEAPAGYSVHRLHRE